MDNSPIYIMDMDGAAKPARQHISAAKSL
jgi:hypothetical protein